MKSKKSRSISSRQHSRHTYDTYSTTKIMMKSRQSGLDFQTKMKAWLWLLRRFVVLFVVLMSFPVFSLRRRQIGASALLSPSSSIRSSLFSRRHLDKSCRFSAVSGEIDSTPAGKNKNRPPTTSSSRKWRSKPGTLSKRKTSKSRYPVTQKKHRHKKRRIRLIQPPEQVEENVFKALGHMRSAVGLHRTTNQQREDDDSSSSSSRVAVDMILFPSVRECNAALAALGDAGELLRALRLFGKMRAAAALQKRLQLLTGMYWPVPAPTLVTYSTLMSRAVKASKPAVALRLWKLMMTQQQQQQLHSGSDSMVNNTNAIVPDVKAANILMNCYAKLADVKRAQSLLEEMKSGSGPDILSPLKPNLVTYNTLLDACRNSGELDVALKVKQDMCDSGLKPDAWTYTSLISTVARKKSLSAGKNDPSLAFALLKDMREHGVRPNGITYSALIDVCGRCRRSDLALQGLRIMLRQKAQEQENSKQLKSNTPLSNEVGAWTAAINACGKAGRLEAASRLFYAMPNFGVQPNTITCGSLTDSLLRAGRTAETLEVLRYMKEKGIAPTEVMYTSLMTHAERLVEVENQQQYDDSHQNHLVQPVSMSPKSFSKYEDLLDECEDTKAIEVYTELMISLVDGPSKPKEKFQSSSGRGREVHDPKTLLVKAFLVFQQMKSAGAKPDLACFNALLRACALAGDVKRCQDVLAEMQSAGLNPNDTSWRQLLRAAATIRRSDLALDAWRQGLSYENDCNSSSKRRSADDLKIEWKPSVESWRALILAFLREGSEKNIDIDRRRWLYLQVVSWYEDVLSGKETTGMDRIDPNQLLDSQSTMLLVLRAIVASDNLLLFQDQGGRQQQNLRNMAISILKLESFQDIESQRLGRAADRALQKVKSWAN